MPVGMAAEAPSKSQTNEEKERHFLELLDKAYEIKTQTEMGKSCAPELTKVIQTADKLIDGAVTSNLAYWDIRVLHTSSLAIRNSIHTTTASLNYFNAEVFAENLLSTLKSDLLNDGEKLHWRNLEPMAAASFKYAPSITYLLGSFEEGPQTEKKPCRQQRKKVDNEPYKNPRGLERQEKVEIDMEERMKHITRVILSQYKLQKRPVDFFSIVLDPDSYGRTVQNIFHVSHLVREGFFNLLQGEDGLPLVIIPVDRRHEKERSPNKKSRLWHMALALSMEEWEALRDTLKIKTAMIHS
ncbi:EP300-interacting inhibitor of differentiation 3 isoform X2 [Anabrus simplex]|uniref:EP300-interacting inhibitor of differentiation 3 isoform X2 n=1 Tax=Anabrus simplex TaxID=316456 RepID=UPI0035A39057